MIRFPHVAVAAAVIFIHTTAAAQEDRIRVPEGASEELTEALQPKPELGSRLIADESEEVQEEMRSQLIGPRGRSTAHA